MFGLSHYTLLIYLLNLLLAIGIVFWERKHIAATWAWVMVLLFLPGVGFFLYLIFGQNMSRRKLYKIKAGTQEAIQQMIEVQRRSFLDSPTDLYDPLASSYRDMIFMNLTSSYAFYTQDNEVELYTEGNSKFAALLQDIREAKHHIHLMYYIVRDDGIGRELIQALTAKAAEGVEVRFLYDDVGCSWLPRRYFDGLLQAGGQAVAFFPSRIPYLNFRLNYRNHRKLAIIDGAIGYIGGLNVGDEYLGRSKRFGFWRDTHLRVVGSAVGQMQAQFSLDWNLASTHTLTNFKPYYPVHNQRGNVAMQIVASGPDNPLEQIRNGYLKMINTAKESICIQSPYFIPDESLLTALKMAALSGVQVTMMIPAVPDHKMVYWASFSYLSELLEVGVRCFLYEKGFLHAKMLVIDGKVGSVGTANVDIRSFRLNFEVNAFIYNIAIAEQLKAIFEQDMMDSRELTLQEHAARSLPARFKESFARLLSPIL